MNIRRKLFLNLQKCTITDLYNLSLHMSAHIGCKEQAGTDHDLQFISAFFGYFTGTSFVSQMSEAVFCQP